jgi:hypothetical protein
LLEIDRKLIKKEIVCLLTCAGPEAPYRKVSYSSHILAKCGKLDIFYLGSEEAWRRDEGAGREFEGDRYVHS